MKSTIAEPTTQILDAPGATLTYDVRRNDETSEPPLFLIGSPMGAAGFGRSSLMTRAGPSGARRPIPRPSRRPTSMRTTCIGSSRR